MIKLRSATKTDEDALWAMLEPVIRAGETYTFPRDMTRDAALSYWLADAHEVFVAADGAPLGTYIIRENNPGGGAHVCNCAFITSPAAQGKGVARAMLDHALTRARERGFRAMQFNFVIASNTRAVALWQANGFEIVGRLPGVFDHPAQGLVDAFVMHRTL